MKSKYEEKLNRDHNIFKENLLIAQESETFVARLLEAIPDMEIVANNVAGKSHDIEAQLRGRRLLFEVKEDVRVADTGNVVVEYESWGKPSGIATTKADFWIFVLYNRDGTFDCWGYEIKKLRQMISDKLYFDDRRMKHTDSKNRLLFFKRNQFIMNASFRF